MSLQEDFMKHYERIADVGVDLLSGVLLSLAIYCFAIPSDFPLTGIS